MLYRTPAVARASVHTARHYQEAVAFVHAPPADSQVFELAPSEPLKTRRTTQDVACLRADYELGRELARTHKARLGALLA